jgi:hypothetical protein
LTATISIPISSKELVLETIKVFNATIIKVHDDIRVEDERIRQHNLKVVMEWLGDTPRYYFDDRKSINSGFNKAVIKSKNVVDLDNKKY